MSTLRTRFHRYLEPAAWPGTGLSPVNKLICFVIVIAVIVAVLETESVVREAAGELFRWLEAVFIVVFVTEYIARLYAAGEEPEYAGITGRLRYMVSPWPVVDLLAILPFVLTFGSYNTYLFRLLRVLRLLRLARLGRFTSAWDSLWKAVLQRRFELCLSAGAAAILLLFSSALLYVVEAEAQPEAFGSIPRALWWSVATLTTVGYGDVTPVTALGRILAGFTAIAGIGLIAMPTGILAAAFSEVIQSRER